MWPFKKKLEEKSYRSPEIDYNYAYAAAWSDWNSEKAITEGYKASPAVFACIKTRAEAVASVPFVVEIKTAEGWIPNPNHPLQALIDDPNPFMPPAEFYQLMLSYLDLDGNSFMMKVRDGSEQVRELWFAKPYQVGIKGGASEPVLYYEVGAAQKQVLPDDMCHLRYPNPDSLVRGQSPMQAAGKAVDVDNAAQAFQKIGLQNRGVPDLHFSFDDELSPDQYAQASDKVAEQLGVQNARKPLVTSKASVNQLSQSPAEMDYIETRKSALEDVCSVYGVPSPLISRMGEVNLANAETARRVLWVDTIVPLLDLVTQGLTHQLASEYGDNIRITYDISGVPALQENFSEKLDNAAKLHSMGVPFNVINQALSIGLDDLAGGNIGYIQSGLVPTTFDGEAFSSGDDESKSHKEVIDAILNRK